MKIYRPISYITVIGFLLLTSCRMITTTILSRTDHLEKWHVGECWSDTLPKRVYILGMQHIARQSFYDDVKARIDSLRQEGYVVYWEGLSIERNMDSMVLDTLNRKMRKLMGFHLTSYLDDENASQKAYNKKKYVEQDYEYLGIHVDSSCCVHADYTLGGIIEQYEIDKGEIMLSDYDWSTPLMSKYKKRKSRVAEDTTDYDCYYFVHTLRNRKLYESVIESEHDKILVVYGRGHTWKLNKMLGDSLGYKTDSRRAIEDEEQAKAEAKAAKRQKRRK